MRFLDFLGVPHKYCAYQYIASALFITCNDTKLLNDRKCGKILALVGNPVKKTPSTVDKGIRDLLSRIDCPLSVADFIFWACDMLRTTPPNEWTKWNVYNC